MNVLQRLILPLLPQLVGLVTPVLRQVLESAVRELHARARETDNPIDDLLVAVLAGFLDLDPEG